VRSIEDGRFLCKYETLPETVFAISKLEGNKFVAAVSYSLKVYKVENKRNLFFQSIKKTMEQHNWNPHVVRAIFEMMFSERN